MPTLIADQSKELDKIKNQVRALAAKTVSNGCTEYEASAAMEKIGELLEVFNLELDDALLETEKCIKGVFDTGRQRGCFIDYAIRPIAKFTDTRTYQTNGRGKTLKYVFYGFESDVEMAIHICELVTKAVENELAHYKRTDPDYLEGREWPGRKSLSTNFYKGMSRRIGERLKEMKADMNRREDDKHVDDIRKHINPNDDLLPMHLKKSEKVDNEYKDWLKSVGIRLTSCSSGHARSSASARAAGARAGNRVNLNRPLGGGSQRLLG